MPLDNVTMVDTKNGFGQIAPPSKDLGRDEFLKLLVAQLSHQDPLEPLKDEDFVAQLAQFSSLEQLENMNSNMNDSLNYDFLLSQTISNTMATSLIGRTVRADSSQIYLETAGAADIAVDLDKAATDLTVTIKDIDGNVVRTITKNGLTPGDHLINWDGTDDNGVQVSSGVYTIDIRANDANGNAFTPSQYLEGKVSGITYKEGLALLNINGQQIPLSSVREVNEG
ncbi:MAG: flagellar hook capping FlgD N-terminal domain-containing protein [Candidatus Zixiibacteriota bacterium]